MSRMTHQYSHGTVVKFCKDGHWQEFVWMEPYQRWMKFYKMRGSYRLRESITNDELFKRGKVHVIYDPIIGEL